MKKIDVSKLIGVKKKMLTIIGEADRKPNRDTRFLVQCDCGNIFSIIAHSFLTERTASCGCFRKQVVSKRMSTHGLSKHPLYRVWADIIQRCEDPNSNRYYIYGAVGVKMCAEWRNDFKPFYDWCIKNGWEEGLEVDKDIKGNGLLYSPEMCLVVTPKENMNHRSDNRVFFLDGVRFTMTQLAELNNIKVGTLWYRLEQGWDIERALKPTVKRKPNQQNINQQPQQTVAA